MRTSPFRTDPGSVPAVSPDPDALAACEVLVREYDEADEPAALSLLRRAFGRWPTSIEVEPDEFFRWKHEDSPFGRSTRFLATVDGEPAGFLACMPWPLRFAGQVRESRRGVDIAVAPESQNLGVARALMGRARVSYGPEVALSWSNPNDRSRSGVLKAGRRRVDVLSRYIGHGGAGLGTVRRLLGPESPAAEDGSLAAALADDGLLARVLAGSEAAERIETARDAAFLRWRYGGLPGYRAIATDLPDSGAGLAIYRVKTRGRFSVASVSEVLTERGGDAVPDLLRRVRERERTDFLACSFTSAREAWRCGLVAARNGAMIAANPLHRELAPDPTQASAWALSHGDLELV